jgi:hypothetical protein
VKEAEDVRRRQTKPKELNVKHQPAPGGAKTSGVKSPGAQAKSVFV